VSFVSLNVFSKAGSTLDFSLRTTRKANHHGFGQLDCIFPEAITMRGLR
jgi:hypothetical protein